MDGTQTWQAFLMETSMDQFLQVAALHQAAEAAGMTLNQEDLDYLEASSDFDAMAASYGLADGEALMVAQFGPGASVEGYKNFMKKVLLANAYANQMFEATTVTDEEAEAYYDANAEMMVNSYGVEKIDKNMVNVRHILIQPETAEDGTIPDEAWSAAEAEAYRIYDQWLANGATEEGFAEAAGTHTQDPGSMSTGGLYEDVYPGQMVPEFNDWCFDPSRKSGDTGIVYGESTSYKGYHLMYFVSTDAPYWEVQVASDLKIDDFSAWETALAENSTIQHHDFGLNFVG